MNQLLCGYISRSVKIDKILTDYNFGQLTSSWHRSYINFKSMSGYIITIENFSPYEFIQRAVLCFIRWIEVNGSRKRSKIS